MRVRAGMSMLMMSPSRTAAMGPPACASGETWPMAAPRVAPLKRPSVMSATSLSRPWPASMEVALSISGMPGAPLGPSPRMTTTEPSAMSRAAIAATASASLSNTRAGPRCRSISSATAPSLTTAPAGARLPKSTARPPVACHGSSIGRMTVSSRTRAFATASPTVPPATLSAEPSMRPAAMRRFMTAWMPPAWYRSSMWCVPAGAILQMCGTLARHLVDAPQVEVEAGLGGDGREVEHRVGAAAQARVGGEGVADRRLREDVARLAVGGEHLHDLLAAVLGEADALAVDRRDGAVAGQRHADHLGQAVHRVGGEHARARPARGAGVALDGLRGPRRRACRPGAGRRPRRRC